MFVKIKHQRVNFKYKQLDDTISNLDESLKKEKFTKIIRRSSLDSETCKFLNTNSIRNLKMENVNEQIETIVSASQTISNSTGVSIKLKRSKSKGNSSAFQLRNSIKLKIKSQIIALI